VVADADRRGRSFDRCVDEAGDPVDPDATPAGGERCLHGEREPDDGPWVVTASEVPIGIRPEPVCLAAEPVCRPDPTVANAGEPAGVAISAPLLQLNLFRWDPNSGNVPSSTFAWVQDPAYIQLDVAALDGRDLGATGSAAEGRRGSIDGKDADWERDVRVVIGLTRLHLTSAASLPHGVRLRFEGAPLPGGLTVAFFAFGPEAELNSVRTRFLVRRIQWRDR
jgi:hypothetical protein